MRDAEILRRTRASKMSVHEEWYKKRKCRLTSSLFGCAVKRRKNKNKYEAVEVKCSTSKSGMSIMYQL
jgi:hypothetical protein